MYFIFCLPQQEDTAHMDSFIPDPDMQGLIERFVWQYLWALTELTPFRL